MIRIGSVVIDCRDWDAMFRFWGAALGYSPRETPEPGWVVLTAPAGGSPNVSLNAVPDDAPLPPRSRLHLDLYTVTPEAEVARLLELGATLHPRDTEPGEDFTVLADPDGNLFCVVGVPSLDV